MTARILAAGEEARWNDWLRAIDFANVRQTSFYARALALYGHRSEILVDEELGECSAGALLAIRDLGFGIGPVVRTSGGIALADPLDPGRLERFLTALLDRCGELKASSVDVTLQVPRLIGEVANPPAEALEAVLRRAGLEMNEHIGTYFVDLTAESEDALLAGFGKNPRRHIRKATREGLEVTRTHEPDDFDAFWEAHGKMTGRKGLEALPRGFAPDVLLPLARAELGALFVARYQGVPRNYLYVGSVGMPIYHWGALLEAAREKGCPQTGQHLHYTAMCHYRSLGKPIYNFGGSPGPEPEPEHPNFTVWKFKHEFGGAYVHYIGGWRRTLRPMSTALVGFLRRGMRLKRKLGR